MRLVIALTPYGVLALMTKVAASSDSQDIWNLLEFIAVSYLAIFLMFGVSLLVSLTGLSPVAFFKKAFPALVFAFTSRSSAATIPLNIETQVKALGNHPSIASLSASLARPSAKMVRWDMPGDACRDDCSFSGPGSFSA